MDKNSFIIFCLLTTHITLAYFTYVLHVSIHKHMQCTERIGTQRRVSVCCSESNALYYVVGTEVEVEPITHNFIYLFIFLPCYK